MAEGDREEVLHGGIDNAGQVVRVGAHVLRPVKPCTPAVHQMLRHARAAGFDGVPEPVGIDPDGRERLTFIAGDVPVPPFPSWSQTDVALASTARLLRRFHDAVAGFVPAPDAGWNLELADPEGGPIVCHNDVCPENVVFRDGIAVALLDFDFAAPGRRLHDLSQLAKMCVPLDTAGDAARLGRHPFDPFGRLRIVADAYDLPPDRSELLDVLGDSMQRARNGGFVARRVERGEPAFIAMWNEMGGAARYERRSDWFEASRSRFADALGEPSSAKRSVASAARACRGSVHGSRAPGPLGAPFDRCTVAAWLDVEPDSSSSGSSWFSAASRQSGSPPRSWTSSTSPCPWWCCCGVSPAGSNPLPASPELGRVDQRLGVFLLASVVTYGSLQA